MKKIGIATFWDSEDNYGQLLQCFALIRFLSFLGCDPKLLKVDTHVDTTFFHKVLTFLFLLFSPKKLYKVILNKKLGHKSKSINISYPRNFEAFRDKYIPSTKKFRVKDIFSNPPCYDAFISGSDQVWNALSPFYFLKFAPKGSKKIAYAASMGGFTPCGKEMTALKEYVKDFDYISLREKQAVKYFKQNDIYEADYVPDPTLLLSKKDYKELYEEKKSKSPYIFLYLLGNKLRFDVKKVYEYAKSRKMDVVYVASQGRCDDFEKKYPTIEEWLSLIENAEMVVTNSFHGTVFAMIYRKKFVSILLSGVFAKMNDRIVDMLSKYGLKDRIYSGDLEENEKDVDYDLFERLIEKEREYVQNKLVGVINKK
ncbi:MAG: polysaccharide pyruvyl transferase family protein [Fibrobacter sp.]|nr:polysaccharide pyruvyl transferase family protein [Fibrobacter sp.]